jgi:adenylate cyclase
MSTGTPKFRNELQLFPAKPKLSKFRRRSPDGARDIKRSCAPKLHYSGMAKTGGRFSMNHLQELVGSQESARIYLPGWIDRLADLGITSTDPQTVRLQRLTNIFSYASAFCAGSQLIIGASQVFAPFIILHTILAATAIVLLFIHRLHRYGPNLGAHVLVAINLACIFLMNWGFGSDSKVYVYYTLAGGVLIFIFGMEQWRIYAGWLAIAAACMLISMKFAPKEGLFFPEDHAVRDLIAAHAFLNTLIVMAFMVFFAVASLRKVENGLQAQYIRSSVLMNMVFPPSIVARLTSGHEDRIADRVEGLTVLFADVVGFTKAAHDLPPEEIIGYLDSMVRCFDRLCAEYSVEKIKTIGDRYMAVGGLTGDSRGQAIATGKLALAILRSSADLPTLGGKRLALRLGLHTGSATAGIIGDTRFTYDVWGDAINVASRMESDGVPGRIQVSGAFRSIVRDAFSFDDRGTIEIRGIGPTRTWFLGQAVPPT